MHEKFLLTANVKSKPLPDGALPRRAKLFIEGVLYEDGGTLVISTRLKLVKGRGAHFYDFIPHLGGHV
jgi:hypothetical protein